jgi:hypothetical protein
VTAENNPYLRGANECRGVLTQIRLPPPDLTGLILDGLPAGLFPRVSLDAGITLKIPRWNTVPTDPANVEKVEIQIARVCTSNYETVATVDFIPGTTTFPIDITNLPYGC